MNITLRAWDKGTPVRSGSVTISLDVMSSNNNYDGAEVVELEISEGLPIGEC